MSETLTEDGVTRSRTIRCCSSAVPGIAAEVPQNFVGDLYLPTAEEYQIAAEVQYHNLL